MKKLTKLIIMSMLLLCCGIVFFACNIGTSAEYTIILSSEITNGTITINKAKAEQSAEITVTVTPDINYQLKVGSLKFNTLAIDETNKFTMPAEDVTIYAEFEPVTAYIVTVDSKITNGTVTADKLSASAGKTITLTVTPNTNYRLKSGTLKYNQTVIDVTTFMMPAEDVIIYAEFENTQLNTPSNLKFTDTGVSWTGDINAASYIIDIDGTEYTSSITNYSLIALTTKKIYSIKVKAIGNADFSNSEWSAIKTYAVLNTVENIYYNKETQTFTWDIVDNADGYTIRFYRNKFVGDGFNKSASIEALSAGTISYTIPEYIYSKLLNGCYYDVEFYVIAYNSAANYFRVDISKAFELSFGVKGFEFEQYYSEDTYYVSRIYSIVGARITIPSDNGIPVTGIGSWALRGTGSSIPPTVVNSIIIPKSITCIDSDAFNKERILSDLNHTIIYYCGSQTEWENLVTVGANNTVINSENVFFYSATPIHDGMHWRFVKSIFGDIPILW